MSGQFNCVLEVESTYEAERIAAELDLSRSSIKYAEESLIYTARGFLLSSFFLSCLRFERMQE